MCLKCEAEKGTVPCLLCIGLGPEEPFNLYAMCPQHLGAVFGATIGYMERAGVIDHSGAIEMMTAVTVMLVKDAFDVPEEGGKG